jgi:hypothetical protein
MSLWTYEGETDWSDDPSQEVDYECGDCGRIWVTDDMREGVPCRDCGGWATPVVIIQ